MTAVEDRPAGEVAARLGPEIHLVSERSFVADAPAQS